MGMLPQLLIFVVGAALPCFKLHTGDAPSKDRWAAYLVCVQLSVVPFLLVPLWIPWRNELALCALLLLSASDAVFSAYLFRTFIVSWMMQLRTVLTIVELHAKNVGGTQTLMPQSIAAEDEYVTSDDTETLVDGPPCEHTNTSETPISESSSSGKKKKR